MFLFDRFGQEGKDYLILRLRTSSTQLDGQGCAFCCNCHCTLLYSTPSPSADGYAGSFPIRPFLTSPLWSSSLPGGPLHYTCQTPRGEAVQLHTYTSTHSYIWTLRTLLSCFVQVHPASYFFSLTAFLSSPVRPISSRLTTPLLSIAPYFLCLGLRCGRPPSSLSLLLFYIFLCLWRSLGLGSTTLSIPTHRHRSYNGTRFELSSLVA